MAEDMKPRAKAALDLGDGDADLDLSGLKPAAPVPAPDPAAIAAAAKAAGFPDRSGRDAPAAPIAARSVPDKPMKAAAAGVVLPWQAAGIRPNRREGFNLRMREPIKAMLNSLEAEGRIKSMNAFLNEIIEEATREAAIQALVDGHGMSRKDAERAVAQEGPPA